MDIHINEEAFSYIRFYSGVYTAADEEEYEFTIEAHGGDNEEECIVAISWQEGKIPANAEEVDAEIRKTF